MRRYIYTIWENGNVGLYTRYHSLSLKTRLPLLITPEHFFHKDFKKSKKSNIDCRSFS